MGRSCVVYEKQNDFIENNSIDSMGNALAFGTISLSKEFKNMTLSMNNKVMKNEIISITLLLLTNIRFIYNKY